MAMRISMFTLILLIGVMPIHSVAANCPPEGCNPQVKRLISVTLTQVAPAGENFYIYGEPNWLARRHNTLGFLMALQVYATASDNEGSKALDAMVMETIGQAW